MYQTAYNIQSTKDFNVLFCKFQGDAVCNGDGDNVVLSAECRVVGMTTLWSGAAGQSVLETGFECSVMGLWCEDHNNTESCSDYEVRYMCGGILDISHSTFSDLKYFYTPFTKK